MVNKHFNNVKFVDDLAIIWKSVREVEGLTSKLLFKTKKTGLKIKLYKTKELMINFRKYANQKFINTTRKIL